MESGAVYERLENNPTDKQKYLGGVGELCKENLLNEHMVIHVANVHET